MTKMIKDMGRVEYAGRWLAALIMGYQGTILCLALAKIILPFMEFSPLSADYLIQHLIDSAKIFGAFWMLLAGVMICIWFLTLYVYPAVLPIYYRIAE